MPVTFCCSISNLCEASIEVVDVHKFLFSFDDYISKFKKKNSTKSCLLFEDLDLLFVPFLIPEILLSKFVSCISQIQCQYDCFLLYDHTQNLERVCYLADLMRAKLAATNCNVQFQSPEHFYTKFNRISNLHFTNTDELLVESFVPAHSFSSIYGFETLKEEVQRLISGLSNSQRWTKFGLKPPKGILFYGSSGSGKSLFLEATANAFKNLPGVKLFVPRQNALSSAYVGDAEANLRQIFTICRSKTPCVLILDASVTGGCCLESFGKKRSDSDFDSAIESRMLTTLLNELDGIEEISSDIKNMFVVLSSVTKIEVLDEALIRPGRFDTLFHVLPPSFDDYVQILEHMLSEISAKDEALNASSIAHLIQFKLNSLFIQKSKSATSCISPSVLKAIALRAAIEAEKECSLILKIRHFEIAIDSLLPFSVNKETLEDY